ncbi:nickel pincer cofactor biosynthesis protein LarC [bacterium]|nr:nickel pincer cofactor biosynthesis protein LarC [bacterium]
MAILYCDCFSGISGDMFLGALIDASLPVEHLTNQFEQLHLHEFEGASVQKVHKGAIEATILKFDLHEDHDNHDYEDHHDHHRHFSDIRDLIETSALSKRVKQTSLKIFQQLAEAEAKVHGTSVDEVHFHEVGAVDSILDIIGAAVGLEYFDVTAVYASALPLGTGQVYTQHGLLPLPAPATMELIRKVQAPVVPSKATVELVTPTGAAILAALAEFRQPEMKITHLGIGAGQRDLEWPNILRVMIGMPN